MLVSLHGVDDYDAHTAARHISSLPSSPHTVFVAMPPALRKARALTPWFRDGVTVTPRDTRLLDHGSPDATPQRSVMLAFAAKNRHVHSAPDGGDPTHQTSRTSFNCALAAKQSRRCLTPVPRAAACTSALPKVCVDRCSPPTMPP